MVNTSGTTKKAEAQELFIPLRFMGMLMVGPKGGFVCPKSAGGAATMEILNSGRKIYFVPMTPFVSRISGHSIRTSTHIVSLLLKRYRLNGE